MSIGHQFVLTGKVISEPKITSGQYGNTAGFAVATTDDHVFYGMLKLTNKPNKYTNSEGLPLHIKKMALVTFYGIIDGYLKADEQVPSSYMAKFSNAYPYTKGKVINLAYGTSHIMKMAKLPDSTYYKLLMKETKKKMKPSDEVKYRYYTLMVPEETMATDYMDSLKQRVQGGEQILANWAGKVARGEKLLQQEIDKSKPAFNTFFVTNFLA